MGGREKRYPAICRQFSGLLPRRFSSDLFVDLLAAREAEAGFSVIFEEGFFDGIFGACQR
ncbi:hypothetical protein SLEP1_g18912 [Rubroshorea leprosula]|uniref:Uncharacterized protein n=1 Tax=Rubroshorea leprosula TaxID=152421 RepID=A0AAV5J810_9ROSI|nr:hypothetical protein SLEP1_g18912 [Rubroshorea leprosula]